MITVWSACWGSTGGVSGKPDAVSNGDSACVVPPLSVADLVGVEGAGTAKAVGMAVDCDR